MKKYLLIFLSAVAVVAILGCNASDTAKQEPAKEPAPITETATPVEQAVPEPQVAAQTEKQSTEEPTSFDLDPSAVSFVAADTKGTLRKSSEWIGHKRGVVINFWGTWCGPCRREVPALVQLYEEYKSKGVEIVSIALNDTPDKVTNYAASNNMSWVMLMGDEAAVQKFGDIRAVPTTIFLDASGKEVQRLIGAQDHATFKQAFEKMIGPS